MTSLPPHHRLVAALLMALALSAAAAQPVAGQPLAALRYAPDVTIGLGAALVGGGVLAADDLGGTVTLVDIANLPPAARVAAAHRFDNGSLLLAFESAIALPAGGGFVEARDLVLYDAALETFAPVLDGASVGIPNGAGVDGVARLGDGTTLLSLDTSVGGFDDEDILQVDGPGLALYLDLSAVGLDPALDVDGLDVEESGSVRVFVSADGSGSVDGVAFNDEDVLVYDLGDQTWSLAFDASGSAPAWPAAADLVAVDVELAATATPTASATASPSVTATFTATAVPPTATATSTPPLATASATATVPPTATHTPQPTNTDAPTRTATRVPTSTATVQPSAPTSTVTHTPVPTATATQTATGPLATATHTPTGPLATATATHTATALVTTTAGPSCPGDCNGSGEVTIDELITLVNIALGSQPLATCPAGDLDQNGAVTINEIIAAVSSALNGCP